MAAVTMWLLFYFLTSCVFTAEAFGVRRNTAATRLHSANQDIHCGVPPRSTAATRLYSVEDQDIHYEEVDCNVKSRRAFLETVSLTGIGVVTAEKAQAFEVDPDRDISGGNFDCLLDLPPITPGCVRLYLCRHGQTENNRLRKMQGARIDPEINKNGYEQAERLGMAVGKIREADSLHAPTLVAHSKLLRAKETSAILADTANKSLNAKQDPMQIYGEVSSLGEVDFGNLDGKDVNSAKSVMMSTFASWATGDIDKRAGGEGESGREGKYGQTHICSYISFQY